MGLVERIKFLCNEKKTNFAEVERKTGISNGQIRRWNTSSPKLENVKKVAEYFNVSIDYLTGFEDELNDFYKRITIDELIDLYQHAGFEIEHENEDGIETILINHPNHGTVKSVEFQEFLSRGQKILDDLNQEFNEIHTIAAHHDGDEWTDEELEEIERFKEFVRMKRKNK